MTAETKKLALQALWGLRIDDFERAKLAFRGLSDAQMDEFYGQSGKTRRQLLEEYADYAAKVERAVAEIEALPLTF